MPTTIHISQIADLRSVRADSDKLVIGAAATYSDIDEVIADHYPDFGELLRRLPQLGQAGFVGNGKKSTANGVQVGHVWAVLREGSGIEIRLVPVQVTYRNRCFMRRSAV